MRAKTVNFERGLNPKDALEIGNENARDFKKAIAEKNYFGTHLQTMIDGLKEGSIKEKDVKVFVYEAISSYDSNRNLLWHEWFEKTGLIFWRKDVEKFIITFDLPHDSFWGDLKIQSEISEVISTQMGKMFEINTVLQSKKPDEDLVEEHFHQNNAFIPKFDLFTIRSVIQQISRVVEATIKEIG